MAPNRFLFNNDQPAKAVSYVLIFLALGMIALAVWVILLSGRVSNGEAIRRAEEKAAVGNRELGCRFVAALVDVSISIPLKNINDQLAGTTLTAKERVDRLQAKARYLSARTRILSVVKGCVK